MKVFGAAAAAAAVLLGAVYAQNSKLPIVDLGYECHQAASFNNTGNFYKFSNIRYAAPPIGNLRFARPEAPAVNRSISNGDFRTICPQAYPTWQAGDEDPSHESETEDCLFLDVFVPESVFNNAGQGSGAPVLVWIYGGGYTQGEKNKNPAGLIAASGNASNGGVIYVAINYRLGAFGWLSGPLYKAQGGVSNLGLHDQRFALEWVQKYIHLFGGDKNRITIFGQSAGGGSIIHQITAYGGLKGKVPFQQAIPQSPGWLPVQSDLQQDDTYRKFLNLTKCSNLTELRALGSDDLQCANIKQVKPAAWGLSIYGPVVDGSFVPLQPGQLLAQGKFDKDVRVMVGHNAAEGVDYANKSICNDTDRFHAQLQRSFPYAPLQSINHIEQNLYPAVFDGSYGYTTQWSRACLISSESVFTCNTRYLSTAAFKNQVYSYLFAIPPAEHADDVAYTYYDGGLLEANGVKNRTVAIALQQFITSFAETGRPVADGVIPFNTYGPHATVLKLNITETNITDIEEVKDPNANNRCTWWQKALYENRTKVPNSYC